MAAAPENTLSSQRTLTIDVNDKGRQFLLSTSQKVILAFAAAQESSTVVVAFTASPIFKRTEIAIESTPELYVTSREYTSRETIRVALSVSASVGQSYVFNGSGIVSDRSGEPGYITVYYDAPPRGTDRIAVGLSLSIHDDGDQGSPTPINHYPLLSFESLSIPAPGSTVWVFIASDTNIGTVLPTQTLRSVLESREAGMRAKRPTLVGRYLPVNLNALQQTFIHLDLAARAFAYGAIDS
jgi:hypothetical protein